jgi:hypothetical protein
LYLNITCHHVGGPYTQWYLYQRRYFLRYIPYNVYVGRLVLGISNDPNLFIFLKKQLELAQKLLLEFEEKLHCYGVLHIDE